jgi:hypothetical protein
MRRFFYVVISCIACLFPNSVIAGWQNPVVVDSLEYSYDWPLIKARNDSILVSFNNVIIRSLDGGQTWQDRNELGTYTKLDEDSELQGDTITAYYISPPDPVTYLIFTTDFGYSWSEPRETYGNGHITFLKSGSTVYQSVREDGQIQKAGYILVYRPIWA